METQTQFIKSYTAVWGEDEVDRLLEQGFIPTLVSDGDSIKWAWLQTRLTQPDSCATMVSGRFRLPFERFCG